MGVAAPVSTLAPVEGARLPDARVSLLGVPVVNATRAEAVAGMLAWPGRSSLTVAGEPKLEPAIEVMATMPLFRPLEGAIELSVGAGTGAAGAWTVKAPSFVPVWPSGFLTVTS